MITKMANRSRMQTHISSMKVPNLHCSHCQSMSCQKRLAISLTLLMKQTVFYKKINTNFMFQCICKIFWKKQFVEWLICWNWFGKQLGLSLKFSSLLSWRHYFRSRPPIGHWVSQLAIQLSAIVITEDDNNCHWSGIYLDLQTHNLPSSI